MKRAGSIFGFVVALAIAVVAVPMALQAASDSDSSALTEYLHKHRLPAVGAQISVDADGARSVMLYGFVATERGFSDAEKRTRDYLHDPDLRIVNRIKIEPSLLALNHNASESASSADNPPADEDAAPPVVADNSAPPADVGDIQQYQAQEPVNDPFAAQGQGGLGQSLGNGSSLLMPLFGGLLAYGVLSSFSPSYYSAPPSYYYSPRPPVYYNPQPYLPRAHHSSYGNPFPSGAPLARAYTPAPVTAAPPSHFRYVPPPSFSAPSQHWYSGGYHGGGFGGGGFGFHGGGHR
ncbi:MAG TPA: hypothetical protein VMD75_01230 [Candidatus Binataceae bacterium]|nr:hypothetical protein [Candidatus Binataceae bacterium]